MTDEMRLNTLAKPVWLHFGAGNLFRALPAAVMQRLIDKNVSDRGIIAAIGHDFELQNIYRQNNCKSLLVTLKPDGTFAKTEINSIAEVYRLDTEFDALSAIVKNPSLQLVSFTITEKAYAPSPLWEKIAELLRGRYQNGGTPLAMVSMDNCSRNGGVLRKAVLGAVRGADLRGYIEKSVSFPLTMTDKITPRPSPEIAKTLGMEITVTGRGGYAAPFVNAEEAEYFVIEDDFPNGRPALDLGGAIFAGRGTVEKTERMKVGACLNPLHTALAVFGCLLRFRTISGAVRDPVLNRLIRRIGYDEGLPVSEDPGVISPRRFLDEVVNARLPNPFIPDTPARIAADTSQKIPVRFGGTINAYAGASEKLVGIPLAIAGWLRYLRAVDDSGGKFELSPDPRLEELTNIPPEVVLSDKSIFLCDLNESELGARILEYYSRMSGGNGAVRKTLEEVLPHE